MCWFLVSVELKSVDWRVCPPIRWEWVHGRELWWVRTWTYPVLRRFRWRTSCGYKVPCKKYRELVHLPSLPRSAQCVPEECSETACSYFGHCTATRWDAHLVWINQPHPHARVSPGLPAVIIIHGFIKSPPRTRVTSAQMTWRLQRRTPTSPLSFMSC